MEICLKRKENEIKIELPFSISEEKKAEEKLIGMKLPILFTHLIKLSKEGCINEQYK